MKPDRKPMVQEYCIQHGYTPHVHEDTEGLVCMDCTFPSDYEECGECGFDHGYEYEEAFHWHSAQLTSEGVVTSDAAVIIS